MPYVGTLLDSKQHRDFKVRAAQEGKSASKLLRELAISYAMKHQPIDELPQFRRGAVAAVNAINALNKPARKRSTKGGTK